ncbi:hypothetical protein BDV26DRAFT_6007 [Aspergillus bertholletiae]|uniref:Fungal-specific transcription factor domain-containing protein n=1 Tax=Aspergillus bertholletiae TaxID=1226010 RepID=A0A5N7B3B3_9EURO|nr:hypothetical protein BDV26DRAFT_6007 [Aspergillus bertholletiae]
MRFVSETFENIRTYAELNSPPGLDAKCTRSSSAEPAFPSFSSPEHIQSLLGIAYEDNFFHDSAESPLALPGVSVPAPVTAEQSALYHVLPYAPRDRQRYATLLIHFRRHVGPLWFDVTDSDFSIQVLCLVPTCPILLFSTLALAARHLHRFADDGTDEAEHYHDRCIELLLPVLNDRTAISDGVILASSVLLRFYEEISAPIRGRDDAWHLLGGFAFVEEVQNESRHWQEGLGRGAFWIHQRQDIINAILNQRPTKANLTLCGLDRTSSDSNPETWAKRCTCLVADVVSFCFGPNASSIERYDTLRHQLDWWDMHKPPCSTAFFQSELDHQTEDPFPEIIFALDASVVGVAYYHLSMLLMAIYNPRQPKIGPLHALGRQQIEREVQFHVRTLCGIALSNPCPPGRVVACLAISQCGAWFTNPDERLRLMNIIKVVEQDDMWPGGSTIASLKEQWSISD